MWKSGQDVERGTLWRKSRNMIKKLRTKFIILSTVSLLLLLGIIVVSSNLLSYQELVRKADMVLDALAENDGRPMRMMPPEKTDLREPVREKQDRTDTMHDPLWEGRKLSPEIMYESRFFMVTLSDEGEVTSVNTDSIAMVDEDDAEDYAELVADLKHDRGFIGDFRYLKIDPENESDKNDTCVIFLDCGRNLYTFRNSLLINCVISFMGLLVIFIIIVIFSKKIVKPVSESYEKQKQFISVAGHEIRTPITIIDADLEILSMEIGSDNEWIRDIVTQTKRMTALTNDLLTLSRMDEDRQQYTMIDFPISDVVEETVMSFQTLAHSRKRAIRAEIAPMLSYYGDENSIRQIVGILLDNAIKYTKEAEDGSCEDILLKLEKKNHQIILTVQNSSEMVSEEQLHHFFDRFYRVDESRNSKAGGYGLGLSIAKAMVEAHRGKISATAPDQKSVKITVILPIK